MYLKMSKLGDIPHYDGAAMSMLTLFESRYTLKGWYNIGNVDKNCFYEYAYSL